MSIKAKLNQMRMTGRGRAAQLRSRVQGARLGFLGKGFARSIGSGNLRARARAMMPPRRF